MATKYFCDACDAEIPRPNVGPEDKKIVRERVIVRATDGTCTRVRVTVGIYAVNGVWNGGLICRTCLLNVLLQGKDVEECAP